MSGATITTFYRYPDLDARIGVHVDVAPGSVRVHLAFLAKGNAYKGTGAARRLYKRNPDRTAAVDRLLPMLAPSGFIGMVRVGKTANPPVVITNTGDAVRRSYSQGGNYRWDELAILDPSGPATAGDIAAALGLVPCENRPVVRVF